ncbi:unannotated protein [freshwater metagenome]|uniref:Unannotated protein n=1 Tax=freshwater metagenome TaxID=449393 RepID=A0A6J7HRP9_9ZZZZ
MPWAFTSRGSVGGTSFTVQVSVTSTRSDFSPLGTWCGGRMRTVVPRSLKPGTDCSARAVTRARVAASARWRAVMRPWGMAAETVA